jgi:hypothetical protein
MGISSVKSSNIEGKISSKTTAVPVWNTSSGNIKTVYDGSRSSFSYELSASDSLSFPISYSLLSGSLPSGVTISSSGLLSGTPQQVASDTVYTFSIRATNGINTSDRSFTITVKSPIVQSFTGSTSWSAPSDVSRISEILLVAGGGGGGNTMGGGGGAGGLIYQTNIEITPGTNYVVTVGSGGPGAANRSITGTNGQNSSFSTLTAIGGGGGASWESGNALSGGSGGGGSGNNRTSGLGTSGQGGSGQGTWGSCGSYSRGGGGGGASGNAVANGNGANGLTYLISGVSTTYAGGGGGGANGCGSSGGSGGGGAGSSSGSQGGNGSTNTGGGGGAGGFSGDGPGGPGGSGIVIIKY